MKRFAVILSGLIILVLLISSCAASAPSSTNQGTLYTTTAGAFDEYEGSGQQKADSSDFQRKVIKNVNLELEAKDVKAVYDQILAYAAARGGYEFSRDQQTYNEQIIISAQIKIDPRQLDDFIAFIDTVCEVVSEKSTSSDITADYFDAKTRLATMERTLQTYYDFLETAQNIDESLKVQQQIDQLTLQIETLKGRISLWDSLLAESTVSIYLRQVVDPVEAKREINWSTLSLDDMGYLIKAGLMTVLNALVVFLQWIAIIIAVTSPLWIVALVVILVIRRRRQQRRLRATQAAVPSEITQSNEQADTAKKSDS